MQRLTGAPREGFTDAQVLDLLTGTGTEYGGGLELLDAATLDVVDDLSDVFEGGTIKRNNAARIHGTCDLVIARELAWGTTLVRPYMTLTRPGIGSARFNLGAYTIATPERVHDTTPAVYTCQGADRLYLLDRQVGDSYEVAAATGVLDAVRQVIADAGLSGVLLDGTAQTKTLPTPMRWPLVSATDDGDGEPATWLRIVNDLLATVNYRGLWCDENGRYRSEPYAPPTSRPVEFVLDENPLSTVQAEGRTQRRDMWAAPNRWVFVQTNRPEGAAAPTEGDGLYIVDNLDGGPTSQTARGLVWPRRYEFDVADQAALVDRGDRQVATDRRVTATWTVSTAPLPIAGHVDVMTLVVGGVSRKVQAHEWELPLDGSDMEWTLDEVNA